MEPTNLESCKTVAFYTGEHEPRQRPSPCKIGVLVTRATIDEKPVVNRLLQLCLHDYSMFTPFSISKDGTFPYRWFDLYWSSPRRDAYLIRSDGQLAGFALVREREDGEAGEWQYQIAEFFILRGARKRKIGMAAAAEVLSSRPGTWEISYDMANAPARAFWAAVVGGVDGSAHPVSSGELREQFLVRNNAEEDTKAPVFRLLTPDQLDIIRPLWEQLNQHHAALSPQFGSEIAARNFEARRAAFLVKAVAGSLRVEIASSAIGEAPIGFCVTSLSDDGKGEVDSLFVTRTWRRTGIGGALMQRALDWLQEKGAISRRVVVLYGNDEALDFYSRFGFYPRNIGLEQPTSVVAFGL